MGGGRGGLAAGGGAHGVGEGGEVVFEHLEGGVEPAGLDVGGVVGVELADDRVEHRLLFLAGGVGHRVHLDVERTVQQAPGDLATRRVRAVVFELHFGAGDEVREAAVDLVVGLGHPRVDLGVARGVSGATGDGVVDAHSDQLVERVDDRRRRAEVLGGLLGAPGRPLNARRRELVGRKKLVLRHDTHN